MNIFKRIWHFFNAMHIKNMLDDAEKNINRGIEHVKELESKISEQAEIIEKLTPAKILATNKQQLFAELTDRITFWEGQTGDDAKEYAQAYQYLLHNFSAVKDEKPIEQ